MSSSSYVEVLISANANASLKDFISLEAAGKDPPWVSSGLIAGKTTRARIPYSTWPRVRRALDALTQTRVAVLDALGAPIPNRTQPLCSYTVEEQPSDRPRINLVQGSPLSLATPTTVTLIGKNLLPGLFAFYSSFYSPAANRNVYPGVVSFQDVVEVFRLTANVKGPLGNNISYSLKKTDPTPSVTTTMSADGGIHISVVPLSGASDSTSVAAQINGDAVASLFVTATAVVPSAPLSPTTTIQFSASGIADPTNASLAGQPGKVFLSGGDGTGLAQLDLPVVAGVLTNRLHVVANRGGNLGNLISLELKMNQVANTVVVTGNAIVVNRTTATETLANIVTALSGSAPASALVTASAIGAGALGSTNPTWLYGGAGETPEASILGAPARIVSHSDTKMKLLVLAPAIAALTPTPVVGDVGLIQVTLAQKILQSSIVLAV